MSTLTKLYKVSILIKDSSGTVASVGYTGWATLGGYGPLTSHYGLGVDQIIGAKIVNARGEVQDANEELLVGIRGGGGSLGVIVELTIKIYPINKVRFAPIEPGPQLTYTDPLIYDCLRLKRPNRSSHLLHPTLRKASRIRQTPGIPTTTADDRPNARPARQSHGHRDLARR